MSLILQALKKAKDIANGKSAPAPPAVLASFRFGRRTRAERIRKMVIFLALPGVVIAALLVYTARWIQSNPPEAAPMAQVALNEEPAAEPPPVPNENVKKTEPPHEDKTLAGPGILQPETQEKVQPPEPSRQPQSPPAPPKANAVPPVRRPAPEQAVIVPVAAPAAPPATQAPPQIQVIPAVDSWDLALLYHQTGEYQKALDEYTRIIERDPMNERVHNNIGLIHQAMSNFPEAIKAFQRAIVINPDYDRALNNLGNAYLSSNQLSAATSQFDRALAINPRNAEAIINLGIVAKRSNNIERAKSQYLRALRINPESAQAHFNLAVVYEEQGEIGAALKHYRDFLQYGAVTHPDIAAHVERKIQELSRKP